MSTAVAMIVRDAGATIARTIASVREHVDAIYVYDTGSVDSTLDVLADLSSRQGARIVVERGEWRDNFAWAREQSFAMVPRKIKWILWLDDDELVGGTNLRRLIAQADALRANAIRVDCDYNDKETTSRLRVVRRGAFYWRGAIHEDLVPRGAERPLASAHPRDLLVRHLRRKPSPAGRYLAAIRTATDDLNTTPHAFLFLGKELLELGLYDEAAPALMRFLNERHDLVDGEHNWSRPEALARAIEVQERLGDWPTVGMLRHELARCEAANAAYTASQRATATSAKVGRNDPCKCGSGRKSKKCCAA